MTYMSLCVVMTDWGNLRDEIFSRTGFAPSVRAAAPPGTTERQRGESGRPERKAWDPAASHRPALARGEECIGSGSG